ncbi:hypothetical protein ABZ543_13235 [Streptomyces roseifaciens]
MAKSYRHHPEAPMTTPPENPRTPKDPVTLDPVYPRALVNRDPRAFPDDNMVKFDFRRNHVRLQDDANTVKIDPQINMVKIDPTNNTVKITGSGLAGTVKIDPTQNTIKLDPAVNTVKIDTANNTVKMEAGSKLQLDPNGNTVKLDPANNAIRIDPYNNTVKLDKTWMYTIPYYQDDSKVGSGVVTAPLLNSVIAETTITKGYWEITATGLMSGVINDTADMLNMRLMVGNYNLGDIPVPVTCITNIQAANLKTQLPGPIGTHTVRFKASSNYDVKVIVGRTNVGHVTTYGASIVCTRLGD